MRARASGPMSRRLLTTRIAVTRQPGRIEAPRPSSAPRACLEVGRARHREHAEGQEHRDLTEPPVAVRERAARVGDGERPCTARPARGAPARRRRRARAPPAPPPRGTTAVPTASSRSESSPLAAARGGPSRSAASAPERWSNRSLDRFAATWSSSATARHASAHERIERTLRDARRRDPPAPGPTAAGSVRGRTATSQAVGATVGRIVATVSGSGRRGTARSRAGASRGTRGCPRAPRRWGRTASWRRRPAPGARPARPRPR